MTDNVHRLRPDEPDNGPDEREIAERRAFDALYSEFLIVKARIAHQGLTDKQIDRLGDKRCDLIWKIIRTPAPLGYHLNYKFEVMREIIGTRYIDGRENVMLESIRNDVIDASDL